MIFIGMLWTLVIMIYFLIKNAFIAGGGGNDLVLQERESITFAD